MDKRRHVGEETRLRHEARVDDGDSGSESDRRVAISIIGILASPTACLLRGYGRAVGDAKIEPI